MAILKNKRKQEAKIANMEETLEKESKYLNEAEQKALQEQADRDEEVKKRVSILKMEKAVEVIQDTFNLTKCEFVVNGFVYKGGKSQVSLSSDDFDMTITIKDSEKYGII